MMMMIMIIIVISSKKDDDDNNNTKLHVDICGGIMISAVFNSTIFFGCEILKWKSVIFLMETTL